MNQKYRIILGVLVLIFLILAAYTVYNYLGSRYSADIESPSDEELALAPDFTVYDDTGAEVKLSDFFGKPIIINFWASWCPPCRTEMPHFQAAYNEEKDNITFIMVNLTDGQRDTVEKARDYLESNNYTFPVYFDKNLDGAKAYNITNIPTSYFLDKDGNIVDVKYGTMTKANLESYIKKIK